MDLPTNGQPADRRTEALAILGVLFLAAAFRLVRIDSLPPGLFQDEAVNLVNGLSTLAGHPRLYYGEREPLYMFLVGLGAAILGPTPLAVRVTSALVGVFAVASGGALARQLFGRMVGLITAFGLACSLWLVALSRVGFRAITQPAIESLGLALLWRAFRSNRRRDYALSGVFLGLSLYSYLGARFVPIALLVFVVLSAWLFPTWLRPVLPGLLLAAAAAVLVDLPLGWYGLLHPEIFFGRVDQVALPSGPAFFPTLQRSTLRTLGMLAVHGDPTWRHNLGAPVFDPLNAAVFLVGIAVAGQLRRPPALFALILTLVMLVPSMLSQDSPHYLRTVGAAATIYSLWALGVARCWRAGATIRPGRLSLLVALPLAVAVVRGGYGYFGLYPERPEVAEAFNTRLAAIGRYLAASHAWRDGRDQVFVSDRFRTDRASIAAYLYPLLPPNARTHWLDEARIGTFFPQDEILPLPRAPALYVLAGDRRDVQPQLAAVTTGVTDLDAAAHDRVVRTNPLPAASGESLVQFGDWLELVRVRVQPVDGRGTAQVTLRWRVRAAPPFAPSIFVHLEDDAHHGVGQADLQVTASPTLWNPGQEFLSFHDLVLTPGTPPGEYRLSAGVYDKASGQRATVTRAGRVEPVAEIGALDLPAPVGGAVQVAHRVNANVAPGLLFLGDDPLPRSVEAGTAIPLTLAWEATASQPPRAKAELTLRAAAGATIGTWQVPVGGARFPTDRWTAGTSIRQVVDLAVRPTAPAGPAELTLAVRREDRSTSQTILLGTLLVSAPAHDFAPPNPGHRLDADFLGVGALLGYELPNRVYPPGSPLPLTLYWRADGATRVGYTVFVHVLDARNRVIAQRDVPPLQGVRPTTGWVRGEYLRDPQPVPLPPDTPPGTWRIEAGLYDPHSGQRVRLADGSDRVILGTVRVGK